MANNLNREHRISLLLITGLLMILGVYSFFSGRSYSKKLAAKHTVICATIIEVRGGKGVNVIFTFTYGGIEFRVNKSSPKKTWEDYRKGIKTILVAIQKDYPKNNRILAMPSDYLDCNITKSDTMNIACPQE